jgi:hypothetical protein
MDSMGHDVTPVRILSILAILAIFGFLPQVHAAPGNSAQLNCLAATNNNAKCLNIDPGSACVSNGFLSAEVNTPGDSIPGVYTFAVGNCPISNSILDPNMILYPLGTSFNSIKVDDTLRIYTEGGGCGNSDVGFTTVCLTGIPSSVTVLTPTEVAITWGPTAEHLMITQDIAVSGTTAASSAISMSVSVHNLDTIAHSISTRYMLDLFVGGYDGTWIRQFSGLTRGAILGYETDFNPPPASFTAFQMGECPGPNVFPPTCTAPPTGTFGTTGPSLYGSISSPPGVTVPTRFVYGYWGTLVSSIFSYTADPTHEIGSPVMNNDGPQDSAIAYFFGDPIVGPGQTTTVSNGGYSNSLSAIVTPNGVPQFPLGTVVVLGVAMVGVIILRTRKSGSIPSFPTN